MKSHPRLASFALALTSALLVSVAAAGTQRPERVVGPAEDLSPSPARYEGTFDRAPVPHWVVALPGGRVNAATHTERTRPVVVDDFLLIGSAGGSGLYKLSRRDGRLLHTFAASAAVESEPLVVGERVYFTDNGGGTWCYRLDGELVWSHHGDAPILVRPTVDAGRVYVTNVDDLAMALDANTGTLVWRYQRPPDYGRRAELSLFAAPPAVVAGRDVLFGFTDGALVGLEGTTGALSFERRVGEGRYPDIVAAPVVYGSDLYVSGFFLPLLALDLASGNVRWRVDAGSAAAPVIDPREAPVLLHPGADGKLRALVALTGARLWTWDSGLSGALTTPLLTPAGIAIGSSDGALFLVDPATGEQVWRYAGDKTLDGISSAPVVAGRQLLFVTGAGKLYSMLAPRRFNPWPSTPKAADSEP